MTIIPADQTFPSSLHNSISTFLILQSIFLKSSSSFKTTSSTFGLTKIPWRFIILLNSGNSAIYSCRHLLQKCLNNIIFLLYRLVKLVSIFFSIRVFLADTDDSQDRRGREETIFYSTLPLPSAHEHWDIYLQLCMWDDYQVFLIATLVFTILLLDEIYHLIELPFEWLIDDSMFVCLFDDFDVWLHAVCLFTKFLLERFDIGNRWIWTCIDYHCCITSEPTNQVC